MRAAAAPAQGAPIPLGTSAKSIHTAGQEGADHQQAGRLANMRERFDLQRVAQQLLWDAEAPADRQHRTCWCHRTSHSSAGGAQVFRAVDGGRARLGGVVTCGQVWTCPVCAAKVAESRRHELSVAMTRHVQAGGRAHLLTFTFPHDLGNRGQLAETLDALARARQRFQNSRRWKAWQAAAERVGGVTSLEVTFGSNGWHPHLHMIVFCGADAFGAATVDDATGDLSSACITELAGVWVDALCKVGLCDRAHLADAMRYAFNVRGGEQAAEYIAKWGRESKWGGSSELTRSHAKVGRRRTGAAWHVTPFQLLALVDDGEDDLVSAWHEYAAAFRGRRMLTWSPGLKAHFGVVDLDDEDLAAEGVQPAPAEEWVGALTHDQFKAVTAAAQLGALLAFVAERGSSSGGQAQIDAWVSARCPRARVDAEVRRRFVGFGKFTTMDPPEAVDMSAYA